MRARRRGVGAKINGRVILYKRLLWLVTSGDLFINKSFLFWSSVRISRTVFLCVRSDCIRRFQVSSLYLPSKKKKRRKKKADSESTHWTHTWVYLEVDGNHLARTFPDRLFWSAARTRCPPERAVPRGETHQGSIQMVNSPLWIEYGAGRCHDAQDQSRGPAP